MDSKDGNHWWVPGYAYVPPNDRVISAPAPKPRKTRSTGPPDPEVARLCGLLADLIQENGSTRPNPDQKQWADACRLLMTKDGPDGTGWGPGRVETIIRWSQQDEFWRGNILSMPKLRKQFDQLRLKRNEGLSKPQRGGDTMIAQLDAMLAGEPHESF